MNRRDTRSLSIEQQELLRERVVVMVVKRGMTVTDSARAIGVSRQNASRWVGLYRRGGLKSLRQLRRGRRVGDNRRLTLVEEGRIQELVASSTPEELNIGYALWTREAVSQLIKRLYKIQLPIRTMGEYLRRWGYAPQRPLRRAYEQDKKAVQRWEKRDYPAIQERARKEGARIHWGDETGVSTEDARGCGYSRRCKTPVVSHPGYRMTVSIVSTITNRGELRFMVYKGAMTARLFVSFLKRLIRSSTKKVFLIVDRLPAHRAKSVTAFVEKNKSHIELFFLPPYAPEVNPDEYFNNCLKQRLRNKPHERTAAGIAATVRRAARAIQRDTKLVRKLFKHPAVRYAA